MIDLTCYNCHEEVRPPTLREALIDRKQKCDRCGQDIIRTLEDGLKLLVEDWEETHQFDGKYEQRKELRVTIS